MAAIIVDDDTLPATQPDDGSPHSHAPTVIDEQSQLQTQGDPKPEEPQPLREEPNNKHLGPQKLDLAPPKKIYRSNIPVICIQAMISAS